MGVNKLRHLMLYKMFGNKWIYIVNKDHERESKRRSISREPQIFYSHNREQARESKRRAVKKRRSAFKGNAKEIYLNKKLVGCVL